MVYVPKAGVPSSFNLGAAVAALITGDATWHWLLDWLPLLPPVTIVTADLCAAGPKVVPPLVRADFVSDPHLAFDRALSQVGVNVERLQAAAFDRVFGAYCVQPGVAAWCTFVDVTETVATDWWWSPNPPADIPAGATQVRVTSGAQSGVDNMTFVNAAGGVVAQPAYFANLGAQVYDIPAGATKATMQVRQNGTPWQVHTVIEWDCNTAPYVPTPQPQPAGVVAPVTNVYTSYADLGAELDRQHLALETVLSYVRVLAERGVIGPTTADAPVPVTGAPVIAPGAIAYRIDVAGIPSTAGEMFGAPVKFHRIGRYTLGSPNGNLSAVELEHAQTLVCPLPPGVDRIQVVVNAPETATVTALYAPKLV